MDERPALPPEAAEVAAARPGRKPAATEAHVRWRLDLLAGLVAGVTFALLTVLAGVFGADLVWLASVIFLPIGLWVGRRSHKPWADGGVYGLTATVFVVLLLILQAFSLGALLAPFVVLPQGIVGAWVGARLWGLRTRTNRCPRRPAGKK